MDLNRYNLDRMILPEIVQLGMHEMARLIISVHLFTLAILAQKTCHLALRNIVSKTESPRLRFTDTQDAMTLSYPSSWFLSSCPDFP